MNYVINICNLNITCFKQVKIVKEVISKIVSFIDIADEHSIPKLRVLRDQIQKNNQLVLKGVPALVKIIEQVDKRVKEL